MFRPHNRMSTLARAWEEIMRELAGAYMPELTLRYWMK
jgi:hypothetical protein